MSDHEEFSPEDALAILRAQIDQTLALAPELARAVRIWYDAFQAQGFSEKQALYLAMAHLKDTPGTAPQ